MQITCSKCKKRKTCIDMCEPVKKYVEHRDKCSVKAYSISGIDCYQVKHTIPNYNTENKYSKTIDYNFDRHTNSIINMYLSGMTQSQIAMRYSITQQSISKVFKKVKKELLNRLYR